MTSTRWACGLRPAVRALSGSESHSDARSGPRRANSRHQVRMCAPFAGSGQGKTQGLHVRGCHLFVNLCLCGFHVSAVSVAARGRCRVLWGCSYKCWVAKNNCENDDSFCQEVVALAFKSQHWGGKGRRISMSSRLAWSPGLPGLHRETL